MDPGDGDGFKAGTDRLIAQFVDTNGDEDPGSGDHVVTAEYPVDPAASSFEAFRVTMHEVEAFLFPRLSAQDRGRITVRSGDAQFVFLNETRGLQLEIFLEAFSGGAGSTSLRDRREGSDLVRTEPSSPSQPQSRISVGSTTSGDDPFIDIDLNIPLRYVGG